MPHLLAGLSLCPETEPRQESGWTKGPDAATLVRGRLELRGVSASLSGRGLEPLLTRRSLPVQAGTGPCTARPSILTPTLSTRTLNHPSPTLPPQTPRLAWGDPAAEGLPLEKK